MPAGPYTVHSSALVNKAFRELRKAATDRGIDLAFDSAAKEIAERLQNDPLEFGEPLFHYSALNLQMRGAVVAPLVVNFGVHSQEPRVFIMSFQLLS